MELDFLVSHYYGTIGLSRYTSSVETFFQRRGVSYRRLEPAFPWPLRTGHALLQNFGFDLKSFFNIYPVSVPFRRQAVKHLTTQMMAFLFSCQPDLHKTVITVHDIVPYLSRDLPGQNHYRRFYDRWVDEQAMRNLLKADRIIAISSYTKKMLIEELSCPPEKVRVILEGVDRELFHPVVPTETFRQRHGLAPDFRYILYVGSENPRKNLPRLIEAMGMVKREIPNARLLKVGTPENPRRYQELKELVCRMGLEDEVIFLDRVSHEDLIALYSLADVFAFPSLYEGFGLPPLEAMACGAPVICSNASSLPEVVGEAAIQVDPYDVAGWARAICEVLCNEDLREAFKAKSLARAQQLTWDRTIEETVSVYQELDD